MVVATLLLFVGVPLLLSCGGGSAAWLLRLLFAFAFEPWLAGTLAPILFPRLFLLTFPAV